MIKKLSFLLFSICSAIVLVPTHAFAEKTKLIQYSGSSIESPHWFKESFLELADDIEEAADEGKKLMIYFHQAGCPYCYNLIQQSFLDPALSQYIQDNFDVIELNLWGDREVTLPDGQVMSEKELAIHWKVQYTPTLVFYSEGQEPFLRIDGYRSKAMLAKILDYVVAGNTETSLAQTLITQDQSAQLYPTQSFQDDAPVIKSNTGKPYAVLFEYPGCDDCVQLHKQVLSRSDTFKILERFDGYRVDISKEVSFKHNKKESLTGKQWADALKLTYFPSLVLFDANGNEQFRIDGYVQAFHFNTALEYVSEKVYERESEFQRFINERAERMREQGHSVTITQ